MALKEGSVVVCPNKSKVWNNHTTKTGTIVQLVNGECLILDADGMIHRVTVKEIYEDQEGYGESNRS